MVVVAEAMDPSRPLRLVCSNIGRGAEDSEVWFEEETSSSSVDVEVVVVTEKWMDSWGPSRGVPVVIVVSIDWLRESRVCSAAECRAGIMEGPGRRWALVKCAHVAMARGPRVYWAWTVSVYTQYISIYDDTCRICRLRRKVDETHFRYHQAFDPQTAENVFARKFPVAFLQFYP